MTLLGRPGCHLCDEAAAMLAAIGRELRLTVHEINIEDDDALLSRYLVEIPVILVDGAEVARAPIQRAALRAALERAAATPHRR